MNILIVKMYEKSKKDEKNIIDSLSDLNIDIETKNNLLIKINEIIDESYEDNTNRYKGYYISYRPSKKYEDIYDEIEANHLNNNTISNYFRSLINKYTKMNMDEREAIIFDDIYKKIDSAIKNKNFISVKSKYINEMIPYAIVKTNDSLYNYLIGGIRRNGTIHHFSIHLYKCKDIVKLSKHFVLEDNEKKSFEETIIVGPREIEARTAETAIRLTKKGIRQFKRYYLNRPVPTRIEDDVYYFNQSHDNIFAYFSRFSKEAIILYPEELKNRMKKFYRQGFDEYNK